MRKILGYIAIVSLVMFTASCHSSKVANDSTVLTSSGIQLKSQTSLANPLSPTFVYSENFGVHYLQSDASVRSGTLAPADKECAPRMWPGVRVSFL